MGEAFSFFYKLFVICLFGFIICLLWIAYSFFFRDNKTFKSKQRPSITWELETDGKRVDTVYVYHFK